MASCYLQKGMWHGRRLLPAAWIEAATARQVPNAPNDNPDWEQGYGYQFWHCRHGAVRGDGAFGQFCILMPEQDAVLAITSGVGDMQAVLDLVWEHLLPAMAPAPLPAAPAAAAQSWSARWPVWPSSRYKAHPVHRWSRRSLASHICLTKTSPRSSRCSSISRQTRAPSPAAPHTATRRLTCGHGTWHKDTMTDERGLERKYVASGAWTAEDTYRVQFVLYETPFCPTVTARFEGDRVTYQFEANVGFGPARAVRR